jgi:hypothetical protein
MIIPDSHRANSPPPTDVFQTPRAFMTKFDRLVAKRAVTVADPAVAGAVKSPLALMGPTVADQVTAEL